MERDPDYIDPAVLKRRARASGGAGAVSSRPRVHRSPEPEQPVAGLHIARELSSISVSDSTITGPGLHVSGDARVS